MITELKGWGGSKLVQLFTLNPTKLLFITLFCDNFNIDQESYSLSCESRENDHRGEKREEIFEMNTEFSLRKMIKGPHIPAAMLRHFKSYMLT